MNTYARRAANPSGMRTSKIIGLKTSCNEHLQKNKVEGRDYCYPAAALCPGPEKRYDVRIRGSELGRFEVHL